MIPETTLDETGVLQPFWEATSNLELRLPRCPDCGRWRWPLTLSCPCGQAAVTWEGVVANGTVGATTTIHRATTPAWQERVPYTVGIVRLDIGVSLVAFIVPSLGDETDSSARHTPRRGAGVSVVFVQGFDPAGRTVPAFAPSAMVGASGVEPPVLTWAGGRLARTSDDGRGLGRGPVDT